MSKVSRDDAWNGDFDQLSRKNGGGGAKKRKNRSIQIRRASIQNGNETTRSRKTRIRVH